MSTMYHFHVKLGAKFIQNRHLKSAVQHFFHRDILSMHYSDGVDINNDAVCLNVLLCVLHCEYH